MNPTAPSRPAGPYETHTHTELCKHARGEPSDYAARAAARGLAGLCVTCHNPLPDGYAASVRMDPGQFGEYLAMVERARLRWAGRVDVRLGLECDYVPGFEPWLEQQTASAPFDFLLGSVHPQIDEYLDRFGGRPAADFQRGYFEHLAAAAETGFFDSLAHPDIVRIVNHTAWDPAPIRTDILRALDRIAAAGTAMELNTSGLNKPFAEMNPAPWMLREMHRRGIPATLGADAHEPERVGDRFEEGLDLLEAAGYRHVSVFLRRTRFDLPIAGVRRALAGEPAPA